MDKLFVARAIERLNLGDKEERGKMERCGALWQKKDKNGQLFFSGTIEGKPVIIFKNKYKQASNHPDYLVYPGQEREKKAPKDEGEEVPF